MAEAVKEEQGTLDRVKTFVNEVKVEAKKTTWPAKDELIGKTIVVIMVTLFISVYVKFFDSLYSWMVIKLYS